MSRIICRTNVRRNYDGGATASHPAETEHDRRDEPEHDDLAAQATQLSGVVKDLLTLVGGKASTDAVAAPTSRTTPDARSIAAAKRTAPPKVSAAKQIPLDDDARDGDFSAFNKAA